MGTGLLGAVAAASNLMVNAKTSAPQSPPAQPKPKGSKWITCLLEGIILGLALLLGLTIRWGFYETTIVTSGSMDNTLLKYDRLLVDHRNTLHHHWQRGDIVIFAAPHTWESPGETLIKRIIGLPGETLQITQGKVLINNQPLNETYLKETPALEDLGPIVLEQEQYYMMGDNRNNSADSRINGSIQDSDIEGRAVYRLGPMNRTGKLPATPY